MTHHLSTLQINLLCVTALPADELAAASVHTAECQACHHRFTEELRRRRGSTPFTFTLEPAFWFRDDHVDFDLLVALADKTLDQETEEIINIHLQSCEMCREDVRSFLAFRDASAREMDIAYGRSEYEGTDQAQTAPWWQRLQSPRVYVAAAVVLVAVALVIGVIAFNGTSGSLEATKQNKQDPGVQRNPSFSPSPEENAGLRPSTANDSTKIAVLKDAGGEVTIDKNGRVTGLDQVSENSRQHIAQVALSEQIQPPYILGRLSGEQSGLRGNDEVPQRFGLLYPARRVVIEDRPIFRWENLSGASSYRVSVLDANGKQVSQSDELPPTRTEWKVPARLRRGQIFSWAVIALVDGKKVVSPSPSAPEMKFAILSNENFRELISLKNSNSHLALGVFYARAGLLDEAEGEFQSLSKLNPQSELSKKLLHSVRSTKKGIN
jgi:hypothetical protein